MAILLDLPLAIWILCRFVVANLVVVWLGLLRLAAMFTYGPKLVVQDSIGTIIDEPLPLIVHTITNAQTDDKGPHDQTGSQCMLQLGLKSAALAWCPTSCLHGH